MIVLSAKNKKSIVLIDILTSIVGCFIFSYAFHGFLTPNEIAVGGVGGISSAISSSFHIKMGTLMILINIPLLLLAWFFLGKKFTVSTTFVIVSSSLIMNYIMPYLPKYSGQQLLGTIFGGILLGFGIALIFTRGFTTGGTDIIGRLLQLKFPSMSIGQLMMAIDFAIICLSSYIYTLGDGPNNGIESALFGLIETFIYTKTIDLVLSGVNQTKTVYIISDKYSEISDLLLSSFNSGLTRFQVEKVYSQKKTDMIMCIIRANEVGKIKKIIKQIDSAAFVMILNTEDVIGSRFDAVPIK